MTPSQLLSFVVPTKNAARTLDACLTSLINQDHPNIEIIVVDNQSTDDTVAIASRHAHQVTQHGPERSAQRNFGARLAHADVLVFIDADMVLEPAVARESLKALAEDSTFGGAVIPELSFGIGYFARCRALEKELYLHDDRAEAARAFRKEAFEAVGGYNTQLNAFEDWDLADRVRDAGWPITRTHARIWHDDGHVSPLRQFHKKRYYGSQSGQYLRQCHSPKRRPLIRSSLWRHPDRLLAQPWLIPGLLWLKTCEAAGIIAGATGNPPSVPTDRRPSGPPTTDHQ
jgi:glycosyltransferase involved in cell wall biosynthesis